MLITIILVYLVSRLLVSASDAKSLVQHSAYLLLRKARQVTHRWTCDIAQKLQKAADAADEKEVSELRRRVCEMAATCRATFDVDPGTHLDALLCSSEDLAILVECSIVVHDNTPPHLGGQFLDFQKLLHRDRRLSHVLESPIIEFLHQVGPSGLDAAIKSVWSEYRPRRRGWEQLAVPNSRWLTTFTSPLPNEQAQKVHYNLLDGELLVDGKPIGCLPREIVEHPTYERILGQV